ncbi:MAG: hypothetical protein HN981_05160 [Candidatus Pacebacteria bacterium]|jgi:hypothetical protein|nr:hypothetical protein [Candidatus Paceibacterota bacterium]MBT4652316.1 hypothetical protein [Candidatus Paceibacterota bacterium]MBT6756143.1 hypothetical protein [Candidatus Paceibacterota bacterium]MBT6921752.1 hypothetical protein [Candidatus Paceibacterota bacterium]
MKNNLLIGITFSHPHLEHLGLDKQKSLKKALAMNFSHIRLGAYWSEIEKIKNKHDFSDLLEILEQCEKEKQPIVMTVGVKAPRWPEFYWPEYIKEKNTENKNTQKNIIYFIKKTVKTLQKFSCITHWQIENEPLDPSGPSNKSISLDFLKQEISLVKKLDNRPVIINLWGNNFISRKFFQPTEKIADIIGLDFYPKQFVKNILRKNIYINYHGPHQSKSAIKKLLNKSSKPVWITELQAEPWEKNEQGYLSKNPKSISPQQLEKNIQQASKLPIQEILLWGFEYWLWQEKNGNSEYLEIVEKHL